MEVDQTVATQILQVKLTLDTLTLPDADQDDASECLKLLDSFPITWDDLKSTNMVSSVKNFSKVTNDKELKSSAKGLLRGWRGLCPVETREEEEEEIPQVKTPLKVSIPKAAKQPKRATRTKKIKNVSKNNDKKDSDDFRVVGKNMLLKYIEGANFEGLVQPEGSIDSVELATKLECGLFNHFGHNRFLYNFHCRSRAFNLADRKNPKLRKDFLLGVVTPEKLAGMTSQEMASDELRAQRETWWKEGIEDCQILVTNSENTKPSMLKCIKCGKKEVGYTQLQTRSADEPMTTFANCNSCGKRWKF